MRKLTAMAAAAALVAGLAACSGTAGTEALPTSFTNKVIEYGVKAKAVSRLDDGSIIPNNTKPIGAITYTGALGLTQRSTDVRFPYTSAAPIVLEPGSTATITASTPFDGWIECTISVDGKVVVTERSPEADGPTVTCSTTV